MRKIVILLLSILIVSNIQANTVTSNPGHWNWNNPLAWKNGLIPTQNDDVIISIGSTVILNVNTYVNSVSIKSGKDSLSALIIHCNLTVKKSISLSGSDKRNYSSLIIDDTTSRRILILSDFVCPNYSVVSIINAEHIFEVQGNFYVAQDFKNLSGIVKFTGTGYSTFSNIGCTMYKMEIGDGINKKTFECTGIPYEVYFKKNGHLQVNRNATFYFNGHEHWNYHLAPGVSLNILNDATVYTSGQNMQGTYNVLMNFAYFNKNIKEDSVKTGNLHLIGHDFETIPYGTIGNLTAEDPFYGNMALNISGTGPRSLTILGNLIFKENGCAFGSESAKDRGNVTIHLKGKTNVENIISFSDEGYLRFGNFSTHKNPPNEYKVLISGNYKIITTNKKRGISSGNIGFYNLTLADSASLNLDKQNPDNFNIEARGDINVGKGALINFKALQNTWFINKLGSKAIYSGEGTLRINNLITYHSFCPGANVTLSNIEIYPFKESYSPIDFSDFTWSQTKGRLYISYPFKNSHLRINHYDTSHALQFNDLEFGDNTKVDFPIINNTNILISGNLTLGDSAEWNTQNQLYNGKISFVGTQSQTITSFVPLTFVNVKINNSYGLTINGNLIVEGNFFSKQKATLDLNNNSIITIPNNNLLTLKSFGTKQAEILNYGQNAFINGSLKVITKSTTYDSISVIKDSKFPVGKIMGSQKIYAPIVLKNIAGHSEVLKDNTSDDDYFIVKYYYKPAPNISKVSDSLAGVSNIEYWDITKSSNSGMNGYVQIIWQDKNRSFINNKGYQYLKVARFANGIWRSNGNDFQLKSKTSLTKDSITSFDKLINFGKITFGSTDLAINSLGNPLRTSSLVNSNQISSLLAYPNPVKQTTKISLNLYGNYIAKVVNNAGKILQTKTGKALKGTTTIQIDMKSFKEGIYWISVIDETSKLQSVKIFKE